MPNLEGRRDIASVFRAVEESRASATSCCWPAAAEF